MAIKPSTTKPASRKKALPKTPSVKVKTNRDVMQSIERLLAYNVHARFQYTLPKATKSKLVAYGPWLASLYVVIVSPQLLNLAKSGTLLSPSGFFNDIFFNQAAWVVLVVMLINVLLLVDGLSDLFATKRRGWNKLHLTALTTAVYILWQLLSNLSEPAAPILSLLIAWLVLFTLYDVRDYYS